MLKYCKIPHTKHYNDVAMMCFNLTILEELKYRYYKNIHIILYYS